MWASPSAGISTSAKATPDSSGRRSVTDGCSGVGTGGGNVVVLDVSALLGFEVGCLRWGQLAFFAEFALGFEERNFAGHDAIAHLRRSMLHLPSSAVFVRRPSSVVLGSSRRRSPAGRPRSIGCRTHCPVSYFVACLGPDRRPGRPCARFLRISGSVSCATSPQP